MYVKLSVIVPIYNTKGYLERCVLSILDQTTKNIEIILVDDGSADGAGEICDQLKDRYDNIKVIHKAICKKFWIEYGDWRICGVFRFR